MSQDLEKNKIFAAILVAGIVAMLCGFIANLLVHPSAQHDGEIAIEIDTSALESASSGNAGPTGPEPILALLATADVKKGEALSKACLACHTFGNGEANKVGPNLYNIVNAKKAHNPDFAYSDVIKGMAAKGETWTYQNLSHFLWKPSSYAPGTKMAYPGLKKPQDRANVVAYLRTLASAPAALPSEAEIAAEAPPPSSSEAVGQQNPAEAEVTDAIDAEQGQVPVSGTSTQSSSSPGSGSGVNSAADKEVVDEAQASDGDRAKTGVEEKPARDATDADQSRGDENTSGKANPALQPEIGQ